VLGINVVEVDVFGSGSGRVGEVLDEHSPGVAVGADGVRGEVTLGVSKKR